MLITKVNQAPVSKCFDMVTILVPESMAIVGIQSRKRGPTYLQSLAFVGWMRCWQEEKRGEHRERCIAWEKEGGVYVRDALRT